MCFECTKPHTDKVSGGLFLTQMNSKSTKALGCFLRMLVVEVAYSFLSSIFWQHLFYREWEPAETMSSSEKQPCLIFFFHEAEKQDWGLEAFCNKLLSPFQQCYPWVLIESISMRVIFSSYNADIAALAGAASFKSIVLCKQHKQ